MALFEDILSALGGAADSSGLSGVVQDIGTAARDSARKERRSLDFIEGLPPVAQSILQNEAMGMGYSDIEEAMRFAPGIMQSRATELAKYYLTPAGEPTRYQPPMGPDDSISITPLPPPPSEADILAADIAGGGMMMAEPDPRSLARARELYPESLPNEEARLRGMSDFLAKEGGSYGGAGALAAASGMDTGFTGRELAGRRGVAVSDFEQEKAAMELGSLVIPGKIGVEAAMIAARNAGPRALALLQRLLRDKGLLGPSDIVRQARKFGSTGAARRTLARQGLEYDPKMFGPGSPTAMARGGNVRDAIMNRYNRMV